MLRDLVEVGLEVGFPLKSGGNTEADRPSFRDETEFRVVHLNLKQKNNKQTSLTSEYQSDDTVNISVGDP